jgi:hypothetical protein
MLRKDHAKRTIHIAITDTYLFMAVPPQACNSLGYAKIMGKFSGYDSLSHLLSFGMTNAWEKAI